MSLAASRFLQEQLQAATLPVLCRGSEHVQCLPRQRLLRHWVLLLLHQLQCWLPATVPELRLRLRLRLGLLVLVIELVLVMVQVLMLVMPRHAATQSCMHGCQMCWSAHAAMRSAQLTGQQVHGVRAVRSSRVCGCNLCWVLQQRLAARPCAEDSHC